MAAYTTDDTELAPSYANLDQLTAALRSGLAPILTPPGDGARTGAAATSAFPAAGSGSHPQKQPPRDDGRFRGGEGEDPFARPGVGARDVVPPGIRPPGYGPPRPGGDPFDPLRGGGMHVGPNDPLFLGGGMGGGAMRGPLPPGARYDPINPEGLPGWHPDDFVQPPGVGRGRGRGGPGQGYIHPDIMPPGPQDPRFPGPGGAGGGGSSFGGGIGEGGMFG